MPGMDGRQVLVDLAGLFGALDQFSILPRSCTVARVDPSAADAPTRRFHVLDRQQIQPVRVLCLSLALTPRRANAAVPPKNR